MAKAQLKFDLENPDDRRAHLRCVKSTDMAIILFQLAHNLKKECEFEIESLSKDEVLDLVFEKINALFEDNGIKLEELID